MDSYITVQSESLFGACENLKQHLVALTYILIQEALGSNQEAENLGGIGPKVVLPSALHYCAGIHTLHAVKTTYVCHK